ncbi:hypothetical protein Daus18300_001445 [Diaporthe australafricana]|uniref:DUF2293 domain-containing protein n=1 Tax=Diaporthe australafricana TaxID=127596 RepID=A0ABR3XVQ9_9PEZI
MSEARLPKGSLPNGYSFVPKGNVYITGNCRKLTKASGRAVYVVVDAKDQQLGLGVPLDIYVVVQFQERDTRADRAGNVLKRDEGKSKALEKEIVKMFPRIPPDSLRNVLKFALAKGKGKVGRTGTISAQSKARLAAWAHARHCETDYDSLLKRGVAREEARRLVEAKTREVCRAWGPVLKTAEKPFRTAKRLTRLASKSSEPMRIAKRLSRLNNRPSEPTKPTKKSSVSIPTKYQQFPNLKKSTTSITTPEGTTIATLEASKKVYATRSAKRARRLERRRARKLAMKKTKTTKKSTPQMKDPQAPKLKRATVDDMISKAAKKLMQAAIKRAFAERIAMRAQRQQQGAAKFAMEETRPTKKPQTASTTASPKTELTAASSSEKRTTRSTATQPAAPNPTIAQQPAAPPRTVVSPAVATRPDREEHRPFDPVMARVNQQPREEILDLVSQIDMHGYYAKSGATSARLERRPVSRGMKQELHDRINKILWDLGLPPVENSLPGRKDLVMRLGQRRAPGRIMSVLGGRSQI